MPNKKNKIKLSNLMYTWAKIQLYSDLIANFKKQQTDNPSMEMSNKNSKIKFSNLMYTWAKIQ